MSIPILAKEGGVFMPYITLISEAGFTAPTDMASTVSNVKTATEGLFGIASSAFSFMLSNPLCFLMIGVGICFSSLKLARSALRASKGR